MSHLADDVGCDAPAGRIAGIPAYREVLGPFAERLLIRAELIAAFGDETTALIMYDAETVPAKSAPAAECVTVRDGKIVHNRFVFDRTPFSWPATAVSGRTPAAAAPAPADEGWPEPVGTTSAY